VGDLKHCSVLSKRKPDFSWGLFTSGPHGGEKALSSPPLTHMSHKHVMIKQSLSNEQCWSPSC